ncbi:hypothetical protein [Halorussus sp. MSC15.2]|uniref:COG1470 family protein n=1 Tax=Halorussus sp. MSC15.2 TaxID=2283638 RepID=UPI0013D22C7C|nr:hypothetical protein [Halorussus sp. MSC15.2]NEU59230.1 hypothetical protein [Halorussus sp. MSC15.2]
MTDERLVEFREALQAGRVADAMGQFDAVEAAFGDREEFERSMRTLARSVIARTPASDRANARARQLVVSATEAQQARLGFNVGFVGFVGGNVSPEQLVERVNSVINAHKTVDEEAERLRKRKQSVELPPLLSLRGLTERTVSKGDEIAVEYALDNIGTRPVRNVTLSVEGYDLEPTPRSMDKLTPDAVTSITLAGTAVEAGDFGVELRASAERATDSHRLALSVLEEGKYLERAVAAVGDLEARVASLDGSRDAEWENGGPELLSKILDSVRESLEQAVSVAGTDGEQREVDAHVYEAKRLLKVFVRVVEGAPDSELSPQNRGVLVQDARDAIATLDTALRSDR